MKAYRVESTECGSPEALCCGLGWQVMQADFDGNESVLCYFDNRDDAELVCETLNICVVEVSASLDIPRREEAHAA